MKHPVQRPLSRVARSAHLYSGLALTKHGVKEQDIALRNVLWELSVLSSEMSNSNLRYTQRAWVGRSPHPEHQPHPAYIHTR